MHRLRFLITGLLATSLPASLAGCADTASEPATEQPLKARIDQALARASSYLLERQDQNGAWRSDTYGNFKDGDALTPLVLEALVALEPNEKTGAAFRRGADYLASLAGTDVSQLAPHGLTYPLYTSALSVILLSRPEYSQHRAARDLWLQRLRSLQLTEALGWQATDRQFGGWGYAKDPPARPPAGASFPTLSEPNLSATVFALQALRAAGCPADDPAVQKARQFVERCQNFQTDRPPSRLDDGGFFFIQGDDVRNKAGISGKDPDGQDRYASYGSTTADGLRALLFCGLPTNHPRVTAAARWLTQNFTHHPGAYVPEREVARPAVYYYYTASAARAFLALAARKGSPTQIDRGWATGLALALLERQTRDGLWSNSAVQVREDDPLVATSLAILALQASRDFLPDEN
jgi:squalene-hopene/tetraprenyl-beta-curcumene cyclase